MVISARGKKSRLASITLRYLKAENIPIEVNGALQVGHFQMHMPNSHIRMDLRRACRPLRRQPSRARIHNFPKTSRCEREQKHRAFAAIRKA